MEEIKKVEAVLKEFTAKNPGCTVLAIIGKDLPSGSSLQLGCLVGEKSDLIASLCKNFENDPRLLDFVVHALEVYAGYIEHKEEKVISELKNTLLKTPNQN